MDARRKGHRRVGVIGLSGILAQEFDMFRRLGGLTKTQTTYNYVLMTGLLEDE